MQRAHYSSFERGYTSARKIRRDELKDCQTSLRTVGLTRYTRIHRKSSVISVLVVARCDFCVSLAWKSQEEQ
ncbi:hypothetical protein JTB14_000823 [Gonioctena quinquepunctata]|nr:hypothetical protein JTB14_000823 [Gonioctena quinquepunctata]